MLRAQALKQTFTVVTQQAQAQMLIHSYQCKPKPLRGPLTASEDASPRREETSLLHEKW